MSLARAMFSQSGRRATFKGGQGQANRREANSSGREQRRGGGGAGIWTYRQFPKLKWLKILLIIYMSFYKNKIKIPLLCFIVYFHPTFTSPLFSPIPSLSLITHFFCVPSVITALNQPQHQVFRWHTERWSAGRWAHHWCSCGDPCGGCGRPSGRRRRPDGSTNRPSPSKNLAEDPNPLLCQLPSNKSNFFQSAVLPKHTTILNTTEPFYFTSNSHFISMHSNYFPLNCADF